MKKYLLMILVSLMGLLCVGCADHPSEAGIAHLENGSLTEAISCFQQAVEKEDNIGDAYRGIAMARWEQGDYERCLSALEKALDNKVERTASMYAMIGACCMNLQDYDSAVSYYELAMDLSSEEDALMQELLRNRILCYEQGGDLEKAKEYLEVYINAYPDDEQAVKEAEFLETR